MIEVVPNWHPFFVHFTVALLSLSVVLFLISGFIRERRFREQITTVAQWNLWLGTIISVGTVTAGVLAYNSVNHDDVSHVAMTDHRNWALATFAVFLLLAAWRVLFRRAVGPGVAFLAVAAVGLGLLMTTGWKGGEVVYRYGLGVMSLPKAEGHTHSHAAGEPDHDHGGEHVHNDGQSDDTGIAMPQFEDEGQTHDHQGHSSQ